jgi:hypothetical protein
MKYIFSLVSIMLIACSSSKIDSASTEKNTVVYKVYKIDSINSYYLIYSKKGDSLYKIVSKKEDVIGFEKIKVNKNYEFELHSSLLNRQIGNTTISPQNSLLVNCFSYDDTTKICLERDSIRDLYHADNIKGIYFI